ncbi:MAG TPA: hypothetical protein VFE94_03440, partial [Candidatus Paceibacterota bacterium]|nr:hypothetical protein [Candidatus Paceibacterota bacterium]
MQNSKYYKCYKSYNYYKPFFFFVVFLFGFSFFYLPEANAATLSLQPSTGTFQVGSTFEVSVYIDTQKETINAIEAYLHFPADKLQLV